MAAKKRKVKKATVKKAPARKSPAKKKAARSGLIRGMHGMFYSSQADELRAFLRDKVGLAGTDVGGG